MADLTATSMKDIEDLIVGLRPVDLQELSASSADPTHRVVMQSFLNSTESWTYREDERLVAVFGVCPWSILDQQGVPWMLATRKITEHKTGFLRHSRYVLRRMLGEYKYLRNYSDARNKDAHRWLMWLGFTVHDPAPFGPYGRLFRMFDIRRG